MKGLLTGTLLLVMTACAGRSGTGPPVGTGGMSAAEVERLYEERIASARMRFIEADAHFMAEMIPHHTQALVMTELAPERTTTGSILTLAARIANAQRDEIATMERWLLDREQPLPDVRVEGLRVLVDGEDHHHHMPGMLSPEEMAELAEARGAAFDRLFLTYMIEHHRGAVTMVDDLVATDGALQGDETFRLASDIRVDQETEIARMESMLAAM